MYRRLPTKYVCRGIFLWYVQNIFGALALSNIAALFTYSAKEAVVILVLRKSRDNPIVLEICTRLKSLQYFSFLYKYIFWQLANRSSYLWLWSCFDFLKVIIFIIYAKNQKGSLGNFADFLNEIHWHWFGFPWMLWKTVLKRAY